MPNIDDGGIVKGDVLALLNPSLDLGGIQIEAAASGTATGVGGNTTYTVATAAWDVNQWADYYLWVGSTKALIVSNTATVLTVVENLTGASTTWKIRVEHPTMTDVQFAGYLNYIWSDVKSAIPEKHRRLMYRVDGEILVADATAGQTTATLAIFPDSDARIWPYKNYNAQIYHQRKIEEALTLTAGFTVVTSTGVLTFVSPLAKGDRVFVDYTHSLPTTPPNLKFIALDLLTALVAESSRSRVDSNTMALIERKEKRAKEKLELLREGKMGIDLFEKINLIVETSEPEAIAGGVFSGRVIRG